MVRHITAHEWITNHPDRQLLDVRSPGEYAAGHWPGALNLPLFSDAERAEVGTLYKQQSPDAALLRGLEIAGVNMRHYVEQGRLLAANRPLTVHCWRGGQRSQSMAWLLDKVHPDVEVVTGGYKALRQAGRALLAHFPRPIMLLGDSTGAGKTRILKAMAEQGATVVDLEGLAHHKGSAFGALGQLPQPTVEQFENEVFAAFAALATGEGTPVGWKTKAVPSGGSISHRSFGNASYKLPWWKWPPPLTWRIDHLLEEYACFTHEELVASFERIQKRLGGQHVKAAVAALVANDYRTAAAIALGYYDKAYHLSLEKNAQQVVYTHHPEEDNPHEIAKDLLRWYMC
ncbi:MAG: tRNA 2-selenouridine(34) synthase MnmH [Saprospiraceae bacterium]